MEVQHCLKTSAILASSSAVAMWLGNEGVYAKQLQSRTDVDEEWLKKWLTQWRLSRTAPSKRRDALADLLNEEVRPGIDRAVNSSSPYDIIPALALRLGDQGVTRGRATSLVSKFALSLYPEAYAPYDRYARKGLEQFSQVRIQEHDYVAYIKSYMNFVLFFESHIVECVEGIRQDAFHAGMTDRLFILRASDKMLMLLGDFSAERMAGEGS